MLRVSVASRADQRRFDDRHSQCGTLAAGWSNFMSAWRKRQQCRKSGHPRRLDASLLGSETPTVTRSPHAGSNPAALTDLGGRREMEPQAPCRKMLASRQGLTGDLPIQNLSVWRNGNCRLNKRGRCCESATVRVNGNSNCKDSSRFKSCRAHQFDGKKNGGEPTVATVMLQAANLLAVIQFARACAGRNCNA